MIADVFITKEPEQDFTLPTKFIFEFDSEPNALSMKEGDEFEFDQETYRVVSVKDGIKSPPVFTYFVVAEKAQ